jgi:hypothetical protein
VPGTFEERQRAFVERMGERSVSDLDSGTIVVLPSTTFPSVELRKITGIARYEERLLFLTLLLRSPSLRMVYVTSMPIDPVVIDYYLRFLDDPAGARARLSLVSVGDPSPRALSEKLVERPDVVRQVADAVGGDECYLLPFNVTPLERQLADQLDMPLYGAPPELARLGSKTGSRQVARRAGVRVFDGAEDLRSLEAVAAAIADVRRRRPAAEAVVVKLNDGFSGQGNAIIELEDLTSPLTASPTTFCADDESWPSFEAKIPAGGAVVEELRRGHGVTSPSVQLRIAPNGAVEVVSTHDQVLGGPDQQVYLGCRFPAREDYRMAIQADAERVASVLAAEGVMGSFGVDFIVIPGTSGPEVYLSEINLRMGGTTHPFWMARLATGGLYDREGGELVVGGRAKCYVATDNLKSPRLAGRTPAEIIATVDAAGLAFDRARATGATLHLLGAVQEHGKLGMTAIADSMDEAEQLFAAVERKLVSG